MKQQRPMWYWVRVGLFTLAAWPLLAWTSARLLISSAELPYADAIVVLSGSSAYVERTRQAAQLLREGRASKIILTNDNHRGGWSFTEQRNLFFVEREAAELRLAGVPAEKIEILPQAVSSTYEEIMLLRTHAAKCNLHSLLFVTSAYHSRRALWTLRQSFRGQQTSVGLVAVAPGQQTPTPATWWWHASGWHMVAGEYPKLIYYWIRYH